MNPLDTLLEPRPICLCIITKHSRFPAARTLTHTQDIRCLDDLTKSVWRFVETRPVRLVRILWTYASTAAATATLKLRANRSDHLRPAPPHPRPQPAQPAQSCQQTPAELLSFHGWKFLLERKRGRERLAVVVFAFAARSVVYFNLFTFVIELSVAPCGMFDCC